MKGIGRKLKTWIRKSSPVILSCLGAAGVISTSVLAVKATPKAVEQIKAKSREQHDGDPYASTPAEAVSACWTCYIPAAVSGVVSIACIISSNVLNTKNQAALLSAYSALDRSYKAYRKTANKVYGEDADHVIRAEMAKDMAVHANGYRVYNPEADSSDKVLFYDFFSNRYFTSTLAAVLNAQYHLNRNFVLGKDCPINDFYEFLGLEPVKNGDNIGWPTEEMFEDGFLWIDFDTSLTKLDDGMQCYVISAMFDPVPLVEE